MIGLLWYCSLYQLNDIPLFHDICNYLTEILCVRQKVSFYFKFQQHYSETKIIYQCFERDMCDYKSTFLKQGAPSYQSLLNYCGSITWFICKCLLIVFQEGKKKMICVFFFFASLAVILNTLYIM